MYAKGTLTLLFLRFRHFRAHIRDHHIPARQDAVFRSHLVGRSAAHIGNLHTLGGILRIGTLLVVSYTKEVPKNENFWTTGATRSVKGNKLQSRHSRKPHAYLA